VAILKFASIGSLEPSSVITRAEYYLEYYGDQVNGGKGITRKHRERERE
jgi:hypothetical protein